MVFGIVAFWFHLCKRCCILSSSLKWDSKTSKPLQFKYSMGLMSRILFLSWLKMSFFRPPKKASILWRTTYKANMTKSDQHALVEELFEKAWVKGSLKKHMETIGGIMQIPKESSVSSRPLLYRIFEHSESKMSYNPTC